MSFCKRLIHIPLATSLIFVLGCGESTPPPLEKPAEVAPVAQAPDAAKSKGKSGRPKKEPGGMSGPDGLVP